ncbi:MAG: hypothetical protein AAFZ15_11280 [Bacteroidota bacterium]
MKKLNLFILLVTFLLSCSLYEQDSFSSHENNGRTVQLHLGTDPESGAVDVLQFIQSSLEALIVDFITMLRWEVHFVK